MKFIFQSTLRSVAIFLMLSMSVSVFAQNMERVVVGDTSKTSTGRVRIQGKVTGKEDGVGLFGATVAIKGTNIGAVCDEKGNYEFTISTGQFELVVQYVGKATKLYDLRVVGNGRLDITLEDAVVSLDEVLIEAEGADKNIQRISAGVNRLNIKDIESLPAFMGEVDVVKSLQSLPGVSTVGEGASGFNVRGGRTDQNLILQDGAILFNASHVLGFFSTFNPDATEAFTLYKGNMPAQYGGRISSVLDVRMKEGNSEKVRVRGGLGLVSSRLVVDGPINGGKTRFLVAGRSSYSDWILSRARNIDVQNSAARFHDLNLKLSHRIGTRNKMTLSYYRSGDFFRSAQDFGFEWDTDIINFSWNSSLSDNLISTTRLVSGVYKSKLFDPSGIDAVEVDNGMKYYQAQQNFLFTPSEKHTITFGADLVTYDSRPEIAKPIGPDSGILAERVEKEQGNEIGFFVNDDIPVTKDLALSLGLRYSMFQNRGAYDVFQYADGAQRLVENIVDTVSYGQGEAIASYAGFEPRFGLRYTIDERTSLKLSLNRTRQYIHTLSNSTAATPTDILQLSNTYLKPLISNNASIGYFKNFRDNMWETSLEVYLRDIENLLDYKDFVDLLLNNHLETDLIAGQGRAYGMELYIKKNKGPMTGWLSYTLSRTEVQIEGENADEIINDGNWYPANFDRTHNFSWVSTVQLRGTSSFNWNVVYSTGRPINGIVTNYRIGSTVVPHFSERNAFRIPDYFRIDLSFTFGRDILKKELRDKLEGRNYLGTLTIGIYNILSRKNAFSVFFKRPDDLSLIPRPHRLTVLGAAFPNITYNFRF